VRPGAGRAQVPREKYSQQCVLADGERMWSGGTLYTGTMSSPSFFPVLRTRSSRLSSFNPTTAVRAVSAEARWIASSVRIGSPGNGCRARSTISAPTRSICQWAAAAVRCARRSAASASVSSPSAAARRSTRSHSISVKSEATMISAAASSRRISAADSSSKSQARTALDSAYKFTASHALRQEARRLGADRGVGAATLGNNSHRLGNRWSGGLASRAPADRPEPSYQSARGWEARILQPLRPGPSPRHFRPSAPDEGIR